MYTFAELKRIHLLANGSIDRLLCVLKYVNLQIITPRNINDLYKYVVAREQFASGQMPIQWGPGNNRDPYKNAILHSQKHAQYNTSDVNKIWANEYLEWQQILFDDVAYETYPIVNFYKMRDVMVHTNGRGTYLSGFHNNVFIVGRWDGDVFGISSCYYVPGGRKLGREINKAFDIYIQKRNAHQLDLL